MIEDEKKIQEEKHIAEEKCETDDNIPEEKWKPVSIDEIYKNLPDVKRWHDDYCRFWLRKEGR